MRVRGMDRVGREKESQAGTEITGTEIDRVGREKESQAGTEITGTGL